MVRLFLPLFFLMLTLILSIIFGVEPTVDYLLKERSHHFLAVTTQSAFLLLNEKLENIPADEQFEYLKNYNKTQQGFPLLILQETDELINTYDWHKLRQGEMVSVHVDGANYIFRWLAASRLAIGMTFDFRQTDINHLEARQTFELIMERLLGIDPALWADEIDALNQKLTVQLQLTDSDQLDLNEEQRTLLNDGKIVRLTTDDSFDYYHERIPDSNKVLIAGPVAPLIKQINLLISFISGVVILLTIGILIWILPLWRSIKILKQTSNQLGSGDMNARASINRNAVLGDLAHQFNAMAIQIQKLVTGHRELTSAVSHELRTPIARMRFGMEMLAESDSRIDQERFIAGLNDDINELESLVDEILTYCRYETNMPVEPQIKHCVKPWLEQIVETSRRFTAEKTLNTSLDAITSDFDIEIKPRALQRAIENLLRNASLYAEDKILVSTELSSKEFSIHVDDDGPGVPPDKREEVFIVFSRLEKSRDKSSGGYGLGLAIARQCVESMGGSISITESKLGGARFSIAIPLK